MNPQQPPVITELLQALQAHRTVCEEISTVVNQEHQALQDDGPFQPAGFQQRRKALLARMEGSLQSIAKYRGPWRALDPLERRRHPEVGALLRSTQDLIMKVLVLDRENEQTLLRRGLLSSRHLPAANSQRPHYVADLYRGNMAG